MTQPMIQVEHLSKRYRLNHQAERHNTLRDAIAAQAAKWQKRFIAPPPRAQQQEDFWALRDVSFDIQPGEVVGIIGRNGAGKSTLLKILSRITDPTAGRVTLHGRVASLLEVGTGFHPELTGRENIFLNGAILGMSKVEITRKFDEIVAFAEIEQFLDTPVKRYSSGMYVRLAFAVAAHLEPEILVVDEVLAVGDVAFQKKCLGKMGEVAAQEGRTVFLVSHNMAAIAKLCHRALLLDQGQLRFDGNTDVAIQTYLTLNSSATPQSDRFNRARRQVQPACVQLIDAWLERDATLTDILFFGDDTVELVVQVTVMESVEFGIELILRDEQEHPIAFSPSGLSQDCEFQPAIGTVKIRCRLPRIQLAEGKYSIDLILAKGGVRMFDCVESGVSFYISQTMIGGQNWAFRQSRNQGCLLWDINYSCSSDYCQPMEEKL